MPPRISSGETFGEQPRLLLQQADVLDVERMSRPARAPPACIAVRPFRMMTMFLPSSSRTCWLPRWKPSPTADSSTIEITPHMIPNIVRKLRSLLAARFDQVWRRSSIGYVAMRAGLKPLRPTASTTRSPSARPLSTSRAGAVADADA